jgi:energy-coupling factor transport system permease protein
MDARGYGRAAALSARTRAVSGTLLLGGLLGISVGAYGLLDSTSPPALGTPMLAAGVALGWAGMVFAGRRVVRSRYRPDPWLAPEWAVAGLGLVVAAVVVAVDAVDPTALHPSVQPPAWPSLPALPTAAVLLGALPAWLAPPTRRPETHRVRGPVVRERAA